MITTGNRASRRGLCRAACRACAGRLCDGRGQRHRQRHGARGDRPHFRAVLHHQGGGARAPGSASAWCSASSSSRAATSTSTASRAVGTTFRLYLPRRKDEVAAAAPTRGGRAGEGRGRQRDRTARRGQRGDAARRARASSRRSAIACWRPIRPPRRSTSWRASRSTSFQRHRDARRRSAASSWRASRPRAGRRLRYLLTSGFPEAKMQGNGEAIAGVRLLSKPYRRDDLAQALRESLEAPSP